MTRCLSRSATLSSSVIRCTWDASRPALSASASAFRLCSLRSPRSDPAAAMAWNSLQNNVQVRTLLARGGAGREITPEGRHPRGGHPRPVEPRQDDLGPASTAAHATNVRRSASLPIGLPTALWRPTTRQIARIQLPKTAQGAARIRCGRAPPARCRLQTCRDLEVAAAGSPSPGPRRR